MKFYFDLLEKQNLTSIPEVAEVRQFRQFKQFYNVGETEFVYTTDYTEPGIYLVEVSKLTHQWTGKNKFDSSFDTLGNIPDHVLTAVRNKQIRIAIISIVEGDNFTKEYWDAFLSLNNAMKLLNIPPMGVLIISGNVRADAEYKKWCKAHKEQPLIEFIGGTEGLDVIYDLDNICAKTAVDAPFLYNSLNRAHRQSRTEHLYFLAKENILDKGLVSGGAHFNEQEIHMPRFLNVDTQEWISVLKNNYPRTIDVDSEKLKNTNQANVINLNIYKNSMMSVVSETFFSEPGLYFSEKTFKPISVGSPQMNLSQPYAMQYLKDKFNIDLFFHGIDTSYDIIVSPIERFNVFHKSLLSWIMLVETERKVFINLFDQLEQNFNTIKKTNFKQIIIEDIIRSTVEYFQGKK